MALTLAACQETLDAGHSKSHGKLPIIDERNPVILYNDSGRDNWFGEYAVLLANRGDSPLAGIIVTSSKYWDDVDANVALWMELLTAASSSGLKIPTVTPSAPPLLQRPADGVIEMTAGTESPGARLIVERSRQLALPHRPLVVVAGTRLTDPANAYLMDHSVADRVVVVASLGMYAAPTATMDGPNGELDPWADWIVSHRFRYVQVSAYYQQTSDVADSDLTSLPVTPLGDWMRNKQPNIRMLAQASDQVAVLAVAVPDFIVEVQQSSPDPTATFEGTFGGPLHQDAAGRAWVVTKIAAPRAKALLWNLILK